MEVNQMVFGLFHLLYPPGNSGPLLNAQVHPGNCHVCKIGGEAIQIEPKPSKSKLNKTNKVHMKTLV